MSNSASTSNSSARRPNHNHGPPGRDPNGPNPNPRGNRRVTRRRIYFCPVCSRESPDFGAYCHNPRCDGGYYVLIAPLGPDDEPYDPDGDMNLLAWCVGCNVRGTFLTRCNLCENMVIEAPPRRYYNAFRRHYGMEASDDSGDEDNDEE